ncbi:protein FAM3D isoform X2 [Gadus morhua]|uniref:protein FAM3D isoform X2 n=1 Tax=Gadus morhua TaxID=8049 RepID=UPI0011B6580E|nr:protein FAM3D-like isoform X2 [Gadus morhua]
MMFYGRCCASVVLIVYIATVAAATVMLKEFYHTKEYGRIKAIRFGIQTMNQSIKNVKKCDLSKDCPLSHYALRIKSGAANAVGPSICFEGDIVMSHGLRNVGPGLNIVQVHGNNGTIKRFDCLDAKDGRTIVLVASFDDVSTMMPEELKDILVRLGSTLVKRIKYRDTWVFAGSSGMTSPFEELTPNDEKTNKYGGWPAMAEVSGCFPRTF